MDVVDALALPEWVALRDVSSGQSITGAAVSDLRHEREERVTGLDICAKCCKSAYVKDGREDIVRSTSTDPEILAAFPFEHVFTCAACVAKEETFH